MAKLNPPAQLRPPFPERPGLKLARIRARLEERGGRPVFVLDAKYAYFKRVANHGRNR